MVVTWIPEEGSCEVLTLTAVVVGTDVGVVAATLGCTVEVPGALADWDWDFVPVDVPGALADWDFVPVETART